MHCLAGISRSSAVAIAYVMWQGQLSLPEAYDIVRAHRQCASPNLNFMGQLMVFGKCLCCSVSPTIYSHTLKRFRTSECSVSGSSSTSESPSPTSLTSSDSSRSGCGPARLQNGHREAIAEPIELSGCTPAQAALLATVCLRKISNSPLRTPLPTAVMAKN